MMHLSFLTWFFAIILVLPIVCQGSFGQRVDPLVQTKHGLIRGVIQDGYSMFLGIPYAKVDDNNPFGASLPYPKFENIFEANDDSARCPQSSGEGTLDCLRLNIHVPNSAYSDNLLPVLIWIHGGAFVDGSGGKDEFGPKFLIKHDIILVTVNYRLGVYGFMCLDDPKVPGNQGLKDQYAALKWVKENIKAFGGDENKITISGESAGSASVDLHLLSNKEKVYSKAILQSGSSLSPWVVTEPNYNAPSELATYMGLDISNGTDDANVVALEFLVQQNPKDIIKAVNDLGLELFTPCIEKEFDDVEPFLTADDITSEQKFKDISLLVGSNSDECLYLYAYTDMEKLGNIFKNRLEIFYGLKGESLDKTEETVRHFYIGDEKINENVKSAVIDFESDFNFLYPIERSIKKYKQYGAEVYRYVFSYDGQRNYLKNEMNITFGGASHADELGYLFDIGVFDEKPNQEDQLMIDRITLMWSNFVKYGHPTPDGASELVSVTWPPVSDSAMPYMALDSDLTIRSRPFEKRMALWDMLYSYIDSVAKRGNF